MTQPTVFTVSAANERLPYVRPIVRDVVALAGDLQQRQERLDEIRHLYEQRSGESPYAEEFEQMERAVEQDFARFEALEQELRLVEVTVVDRNSGLVEMQSKLEDQLIWLNWQPDESEFMFWRNSDDDSMMRRPLLESVGGSDDSLEEQSM